jgi:hypothetical protein
MGRRAQGEANRGGARRSNPRARSSARSGIERTKPPLAATSRRTFSRVPAPEDLTRWGRGVVAASAFLLASIHPSARKGNSPKFGCSILYSRCSSDREVSNKPGPIHGSRHHMLWRWIKMRIRGCSEASPPRSYTPAYATDCYMMRGCSFLMYRIAGRLGCT